MTTVVPLRSPTAIAAERLERLANRPLTPRRRELRDLAARLRAIDAHDRDHDEADDQIEFDLEAAA